MVSEPFEWHAGHLSTLLLVLAVALRYAGHDTPVLWASLGACLDQLVFLVVHDRHGYFEPPSVVGGAIAVGGFLLVYAGAHAARRWVKAGERGDRDRVFAATAAPGVATYAAVVVVVIAGFRLVQVAMGVLGIDNEHRSLFLAGYEVHHVNHGIVAIAIAVLLLRFLPAGSRTRTPTLVLLALGNALVIDQITYYALVRVTDPAYLGMPSLAGAVVFAALTTAVVAVSRRRQPVAGVA